LADIDDYPFDLHDEFERHKKHQPLKKHVVGSTPMIPRQENDQKFEWFNVQGESIYSNPPDPQSITIDHGLDEDHIWAFQRSLFN